MKQHRALEWLHLYSKRYPWAWETYATLLADPPAAWPPWCWCPLAGAYAVLSRGRPQLSLEQAADLGALGGLAAWRCTQGIFRIHPTLLSELLDTPVTGDIPAEVLTRLPAWCVYLETPGHSFMNMPLAGFFAFLEHDANDGHGELRLLLDLDEARRAERLAQLVIYLGGTIEDGLRKAVRSARINALREGHGGLAPSLPDFDEGFEAVAKLISALLYLCADDAEIEGRRPPPARVVRGRKRPLLPAPPKVTIHPCGYRIGAALDLARSKHNDDAAPGGDSGTTRAPHVRRAHWHRFWIGPRDAERSLRIRWLSPILVNADTVPNVATVIPVRDA